MRTALRVLDRGIESAIVIIFAAMVLAGGMQVFNRFLLNDSLSWSEEFQKYAHIWLVFLAIPVAYNRGSHIGMNMFARKLPLKLQFGLVLLADALWLVLAGAMVFCTASIMAVAKSQISPGLGLRMDHVYTALVVGGAYLATVVFRKIAEHLSKFQSGEFEGV